MRYNYNGKLGWQVWTALDNANKPPTQIYGTFFFLADDGSVCRVTTRANEPDDMLEIKHEDRS